jgi:hypothetical protein
MSGIPRGRTVQRFVCRTLGSVLLIAFAGTTAALASAPQVRIAGNRFVDGRGHTIRLIGADGGPDLSDACVQPTYGDPYRSGGVFGGPVDNRAIALMVVWKMNAVRISLNEDCWLGINPVQQLTDRIVEPAPGGPAAGARIARRYQAQVEGYVRRLHNHGLMVIVDLHWSAPGRDIAFDQWPLPDSDHSLTFWRSVAATFKHDHSIVFDAFNEPFLSDPETLSWSCLRDGCRLPNRCADCDAEQRVPGCGACPTAAHPDGTYRAAGMQAIVNAIRSTGARQPIITPGRSYTNDLTRWWRFRPQDPLHQLGVSFHSYQGERCSDPVCFDRLVRPLAARVPVVIGEFGPSLWAGGKALTQPCDETWDQRLMNWADRAGVSYLAWAWYFDSPPAGDAQPADCSYDLLGRGWYSAAPRPGHGEAVFDHLADLAAARDR